MMTRASVLLVLTCRSAYGALSESDRSEIRAAIRQAAKDENLKGTGEVWSERGPVVYKVTKIESPADDVAIVDATEMRAGTFSFGPAPCLFILKREDGHWK